MATYVLVHGAWSGAHGFRRVRPLLQAAGHQVFTPSLTGIGERVHLVSPQVDLTTHIRDVVNQVLYEDLDDIVLLGFSYGGFVVTGALEHIARAGAPPGLPRRLRARRRRHRVRPGRAARPAARSRLGDPWLVPPTPREFDDPAEAAFANPRRDPHPIGCFTEPVRLRRPLEAFPFGRTYIRATADAPDAPGTAVFDAAAARARSSPAWTTTRSPPTTWSPTTGRRSWPSCCSRWRDRGGKASSPPGRLRWDRSGPRPDSVGREDLLQRGGRSEPVPLRTVDAELAQEPGLAG